jgi:5-methylcytosine-specific restriction enzyme B
LILKETHMAESLTDRILRYVYDAIIEPARKTGRTCVAVTAGDVHKDLRLENRMPAVCAALDAAKFQEQYRVVLSRRSGPKQSSTVTWLSSIEK